MVQSALASAAEALPPPAVSVPSGIKQTQQRGRGRLQFGQAIGRVEDAEADEDAAAAESTNRILIKKKGENKDVTKRSLNPLAYGRTQSEVIP